MAQLIVPNAFQTVVEMEVSGQQIINVIGIHSADAATSAIQVGVAVQAAWEMTGGPLSQLSTFTNMGGYRTTDLRSADGSINFFGSTAKGGFGASQLSTLAVSGLVQYGTGSRNRSSRGRLYFGPLAENQINADGRTVAAAPRASIGAAFEQFRVTIGGGDLSWAVISRVRSTAYIISTEPVVANVVATQRRRLR